jgi:hypothetical protein
MTRSPSDHSGAKTGHVSAGTVPSPARKLSAGAAPRKRSAHSKLIIPFLSAGLLVAGGVMIARDAMQRPHSASAVVRDLRDLALQRGVRPGQPDGGELGPWWISASSFDPLSGELKNFRLKSGPIELAAQSARILVDPEADSIGFDLWRVVYTVLPNLAHPDQVGELIELETYTLGPVPYGHEIVQDSGSDAPPNIPPRTTPARMPDPIAGVTN